MITKKEVVSILAKWTGDVVGEMHVNKIKFEELANELGWNVKYLSSVLNCRRSPKDAEKKCREALENLKAKAL